VHRQNNSAVVCVPEPMRGRVEGILVTSGKAVKIFLALMALSVFFDLVTAASCSYRVNRAQTRLPFARNNCWIIV
jgi:hypothetical protein